VLSEIVERSPTSQKTMGQNNDDSIMAAAAQTSSPPPFRPY